MDEMSMKVNMNMNAADSTMTEKSGMEQQSQSAEMGTMPETRTMQDDMVTGTLENMGADAQIENPGDQSGTVENNIVDIVE